MKNFINEFKEFIKKGNVVDLAVAVVIGAAFSSIVNSLVDDVFMPIVGILVGGVDFSRLSLTLGEATIYYGRFLQNIINFLIIAFALFMIVKVMNNFSKKKEATTAPKKEEVQLLEEIRDLLKKNK